MLIGQAKKAPDGGVQISVEDNGPGIPPEEHENIFKPFYQVDKHRTGNIRGTGLGLAIVQYLAAAHGGEVRVQSELGKNTKFTLNFSSPS